MKTEDFFVQPRTQSRIKTAIVSEYFDVWANVILPSVVKRSGVMAYIDLFAGKGSFDDGTESTPLKILRKAIAHPHLCKRLMTEFNDADQATAEALQDAVMALPGIENLRFKPKVTNLEVGENTVKRFESAHLPPTLLFADPFGFKGLSLGLFKAVLKDWGCDCIFFFNFESINRWLTAEIVRKHMDLLFGKECAAELRASLPALPPGEREATIINALKRAIKNLGIPYIHPFSFTDEHRDRTSHHLILATKSNLGYTRMKDITAGHSTESNQGVPSFNYDPSPDAQTSFAFETPLDDLQSMLMDEFAGRTLSVREIHDLHCVDRPYRLPDYRRALRNLEDRGMVNAAPPAGKRRGVFPDHVQATFPPKPRKEVK